MRLPLTTLRGRQWRLRLTAASLLLCVAGCGEYHGPVGVRVQNRYPQPIKVYRTGLDPDGKRDTALLGRVDAGGTATFPGVLPAGEKVYHLKFRDEKEKLLGDEVIPAISLQKKLGADHTWSVTASP
jgi:hypothetical protein